ncbi:hypothetical protein PJL18_01459 [Paenarthrobacter nicotinovorans]|nr:hypothetical protein [Paenarthrobacter nicotinovorans]
MFGIPEINLDPVTDSPVSGLSSGDCPLAQRQQAVFVHIQDGLLKWQLVERSELSLGVEACRRFKTAARHQGQCGGHPREPEDSLGASPPVEAHQVPLAEAAAESPWLHLSGFLAAGADGEVAETDGVPAMHGGNDVVESLSGWFDPRLNPRRKFDVGESAGGLQLTDGIGGSISQGSALPQLGGQKEDRALCRSQLHFRQPVGVLTDPVAR